MPVLKVFSLSAQFTTLRTVIVQGNIENDEVSIVRAEYARNIAALAEAAFR